MRMLNGKVKVVARSTAVALLLGLAVSGDVAAQATPTEEATQAADTGAPTTVATTATTTTEEEDEGFDDWGLLGLLGLGGLAGLRKRTAHVIEPVRTERVETVTDPTRTQRVDVDPNIDTRDPRR